jgi:hypothetical protein
VDGRVINRAALLARRAEGEQRLLGQLAAAERELGSGVASLAQRAKQAASEQAGLASEQAGRCAARVQALVEAQLADVRGDVEQLRRGKADVSHFNLYTGVLGGV